jgi:hypothetical protein
MALAVPVPCDGQQSDGTCVLSTMLWPRIRTYATNIHRVDHPGSLLMVGAAILHLLWDYLKDSGYYREAT